MDWVKNYRRDQTSQQSLLGTNMIDRKVNLINLVVVLSTATAMAKNSTMSSINFRQSIQPTLNWRGQTKWHLHKEVSQAVTTITCRKQWTCRIRFLSSSSSQTPTLATDPISVWIQRTLFRRRNISRINSVRAASLEATLLKINRVWQEKLVLGSQVEAIIIYSLLPISIVETQLTIASQSYSKDHSTTRTLSNNNS